MRRNIFIISIAILTLMFNVNAISKSSAQEAIDLSVTNLRTIPSASDYTSGTLIVLADMKFIGPTVFPNTYTVEGFVDGIEQFSTLVNNESLELAPGTPQILSYNEWNDVIPGTHTIKFVIDSNNDIAETDETNNILELTFVIPEPVSVNEEMDESMTIEPEMTEEPIIDKPETIETPAVSDPTPTSEKVVDNETMGDVISRERSMVRSIDEALFDRLQGKILLQVEERGEAWYLDVVSRKKFYLKDGPAAYQALRAFGLGVTTADINKIPVGFEDRFDGIDTDGDGLSDKIEEALGTDPENPDSDGDGFSDGTEVRGGYNPLGLGKSANDTSLANRLKGKILLQVEDRGEAWYVHPEDGKRYYMRDGEAAYQIMRFLSLGITNDDLRKIDVGELE